MMSENALHPLFAAIEDADVSAIRRLAASGSDLNMRDDLGEPVLFKAVDSLEFSEDEGERDNRLAIICELVDLGADLNGLDEVGGSILIGPVFGQQAGLVEVLLRLGVDPNHGCSDSWETVYDAAIFDYEYEAWTAPSLPPLLPLETHEDDEDRYLAWLDREAEEKSYLRPVIPILLRRFGALTATEVAAKLGASSDQKVRWTECGWAIAT